MSRRSHGGWIRLPLLFAFAFTLLTCSLDRHPGESAGGNSRDGGREPGSEGSGASGASAASGRGGTGGSAGKGGSSGAMNSDTACKGILEPVTAATADGAAVEIAIAFADTGCKLAPDFAGTNYEAFPGW